MGNYFRKPIDPFICDLCANMTYDVQLGICDSCEAETFSKDGVYCKECSSFYHRCMACGKLNN